MADIRAARTEQEVGHSGLDDSARNPKKAKTKKARKLKKTQEHSPFDSAQGRQE
jgi:hypothetical protein